MGNPARHDVIRQVIRSMDLSDNLNGPLDGLVTHQFNITIGKSKRLFRVLLADYSPLTDTPAGTGYGRTVFDALQHACYAFLLGNESTVWEDGRYWDYSPVVKHSIRDLPATFLELQEPQPENVPPVTGSGYKS